MTPISHGALIPVAGISPFPASTHLADYAQPATPVGIAGEMIDAVPVAITIQNEGASDDVLLGAVSPAAARIEPHHTLLRDGQRVMMPLPDGIIIPAGATVLLEAGADHLMLRGLREPLVQGQTFPLTLRFARAGEVTVEVRVRRKLDAAGITPFPPVVAGDLTISLASAPPAPGPRATPIAGEARRPDAKGDLDRSGPYGAAGDAGVAPTNAPGAEATRAFSAVLRATLSKSGPRFT